MKLFDAAGCLSLLLCCSSATIRLASSACITEDFALKVNNATACSYTNVLSAFGKFYQDPINVSPTGPCAGITAEMAFWQLLPATDRTTAQSRVNSICAQAFSNYNKNLVTFDQIVKTNGTNQAANLEFVKNFFAGRTDWNEEYETKYGSIPNGVNYKKILADDAALVDNQYYAAGKRGKIVFPSNLPQFSNCQANSVYCCWTSDRQPNDGSGDCQYPTDSECVDANPADNANLCLVQHAAGSSSTTWKSSTGSFIFNGDNQDGEGPINCHGIVWDEFNQNDPSFVYRGNNLFYISMFDNFRSRGYVRNIPGAPMCACAEKMPVVSRSDCTEMSVLQDFNFNYENGAFAAEVVNIDISYNACKGIGCVGKATTNDLWSYYNRLFYEGRVSASKFRTFSQHVLVQDLCRLYEKMNMAYSGLAVGYKPDATWFQVAGRDATTLPFVIGKKLFDLLFAGAGDKIIRRTCPSCLRSHQNIYYLRITPIPDSLNLLAALLSQHGPIEGQTYGKDFLIYSTYDDAVQKINAWPCISYNTAVGYPGDCGPTNGVYRDQSSWFDWGGGRSDVAFFVKASTLSRALVQRPTVHIGKSWDYGRQTYTGIAFELRCNVYMTGVGIDVWEQRDSFTYSAKSDSGDITVTVQVGSFIAERQWAKAGLMIRASNDPGSVHFSAFLTPSNGASAVWREEFEGFDQGIGDEPVEYRRIFLRIKKIGNTFTAFKSLEHIKWTPLNEDPISIPNFPTTFQVGLAMTPEWGDNPVEAVFSDLTIEK